MSLTYRYDHHYKLLVENEDEDAAKKDVEIGDLMVASILEREGEGGTSAVTARLGVNHFTKPRRNTSNVSDIVELQPTPRPIRRLWAKSVKQCYFETLPVRQNRRAFRTVICQAQVGHRRRQCGWRHC